MKKNEQQRKEYEAYVKQFTPKPKLLRNGFKAFLVGGGICCGAYWIQTWLTGRWGLPE